MRSQVVEELAEQLLSGNWNDAADPSELGAAVVLIRDRIDSGLATDLAAIRNATGVLNENCHFDHTATIGRAWKDRRGFDPIVVKRLAQALIDLGGVEDAEKILEDGLHRLPESPDVAAKREIPEYEGLLGRVYKQRFVLTGDPAFLVRARQRYLDTYRRNPRNYWHGINAIALRAREEQEQLDSRDVPASRDLAAELIPVVQELLAADPDDKYLVATLSEAFLAASRCDEAELWLYRYLSHQEVRKFGLKSYDRQLREIWRGNPMRGNGTCPDRLSAILTRHIAQTDRRFLISPGDVPNARETVKELGKGLEKNFLGESTFTVDSIEQLLQKCESIGCVAKVTGERVGTGFLIAAENVGLPSTDPPVFVTNAHVISPDAETALKPEAASVIFEMESRSAGKPVHHKVKELLFHSPPGALGAQTNAQNDLDVAIVTLEDLPAGATPLPLAKSVPLVTAKTKVYVIGHPQGSGLQISLQDSTLLDIDDAHRLMHYRTPTDPGSSGSPVLNKKWEVVALHHGGSSEAPRLHGDGTYEANEGILIKTIVITARGAVADRIAGGAR